MRVLMAILMLGVVVAPSRWAAARPLIICCQENGDCRITTDAACKDGEIVPADFQLKVERGAEDIPLRMLIALGIFAFFATVAYCCRAVLDLRTERERAKAKSLETAGEFVKSFRHAGENADVQEAL